MKTILKLKSFYVSRSKATMNTYSSLSSSTMWTDDGHMFGEVVAYPFCFGVLKGNTFSIWGEGFPFSL